MANEKGAPVKAKRVVNRKPKPLIVVYKAWLNDEGGAEADVLAVTRDAVEVITLITSQPGLKTKIVQS